MSETEQPTPEPGDADTTEVQTPEEAPAAPSPLEAPAEEPPPVEEPPAAAFSTPAAFSAPTPPPDLPPADTGSGAAGGSPVDKAAEVASERPEVLVGAAFAGGLALAFLLRRLGG